MECAALRGLFVWEEIAYARKLAAFYDGTDAEFDAAVRMERAAGTLLRRVTMTLSDMEPHLRYSVEQDAVP